jgi:hypothetical protein
MEGSLHAKGVNDDLPQLLTDKEAAEVASSSRRRFVISQSL